MNEKHITNLESHIEKLVEGAFTSLFRKHVSAHDMAIALARSMEDNLRYEQETDPRPIAPDEYTLRLHPSVEERLRSAPTSLAQVLSDQLVELAVQAGYRLPEVPILKILADEEVDVMQVRITARHSSANSTQAMQPISPPLKNKRPSNPHLIVGTRTIPLTQSLINIGRSSENHIVIEDAYISRHHLQIRLRFGEYLLFDVKSRAGTLVNNIRVTEHRLQSGDVIVIGNTKMVYMTDDEPPPHTTQILDVVE